MKAADENFQNIHALFLLQSEYKQTFKSPKFRQTINSFRKTVMDSIMNKEFPSVFLDEAFCFSKKDILQKISILP